MSSHINCEFCGILVLDNNYLNHISLCTNRLINESEFNEYYDSMINYDDVNISITNDNNYSSLNNNNNQIDTLSIVEEFNNNFQMEIDLEDNQNDTNQELLENLRLFLNEYIGPERIRNTRIIIESNSSNIENNDLSFFEDVKIGLKKINEFCEINNFNQKKYCSICYDDCNENTKFCKMLCKHEFCKDCAFKWFAENCKCPLCNKDLRELKINNKKE